MPLAPHPTGPLDAHVAARTAAGSGRRAQWPRLGLSAPVDLPAVFGAATAAGVAAWAWRGDEGAWVALGCARSGSDPAALLAEMAGGAALAPDLPRVLAALPFGAGGAAGAADPFAEWSLGAGLARVPAVVLAADGRQLLLSAEGAALAARFGRAAPESAAVPWAGAWSALESQADFEARVALAAARCGVGSAAAGAGLGAPEAAAALQKVVLARATCARPAPGSRFSVAATLAALWRAPTGTTVFAVSGPAGAAFVGASPETLVAVGPPETGGALPLRTVALAGTAACAADADRAPVAAALLACPKERAEHRAVVAGIEAALAPLCLEIEAGEAPVVRALPGLLHLETPVRARLRPGSSAWAAVRALHPTPALGGWPRAAALAWLAAHEPLVRGLYAAPVGWLGADGRGHFVVGIRSARVQPAEAVLFAGAGVVAASVPAAEWRETELKLGAARAALRVVPLGPAGSGDSEAGT